jgi:hypothetical protein
MMGLVVVLEFLMGQVVGFWGSYSVCLALQSDR